MSESPSTSLSSDVQTDDERRESAEFEQVDWDDVGGWRQHLTLKRILLAVGIFAVADLYNYHRKTGELFLVMRYKVGPEDWLVFLSLVVLGAYIGVPLVRRPGRLKRILLRFRKHPGTLLSLLVLTVIISVGIWALLKGFIPRNTLVTGDSLDNFHPPSWEYPLGTDRFAYELTDLLIMGTIPVFYALFVTAGIIVPVATLVGIVAGYYGGLVDDLLMAYVDIQLSLPAVVIYLLAYMFFFESRFVFLVAFGLLSWGGIARIVRSETLQRREEGYVLSARAVGAPRWYVIRKHIFPNVTNSVIPATFQLIAIIVLTEAGLALLGFEPFTQTWGQTIGDGLRYGPPLKIWWNSTIPALALAGTVLSCKLAGDGLRDVLDPRGDR